MELFIYGSIACITQHLGFMHSPFLFSILVIFLMCIIINQHHEVAFGQNKHYEVAAVVYASKTGLRRIWQLHWKLKDKKMKQSGGPLLKLRREMMCYLRKLGIVNTGPTSFKILCRSWYLNLLLSNCQLQCHQIIFYHPFGD